MNDKKSNVILWQTLGPSLEFDEFERQRIIDYKMSQLNQARKLGIIDWFQYFEKVREVLKDEDV